MNIVVLARDMWVAKQEGKERLSRAEFPSHLDRSQIRRIHGIVQEEAQSATADPLISHQYHLRI